MNKKEFEDRKEKVNKEINLNLKQNQIQPLFPPDLEYPEYIGYYFRDYLKVLQLQIKNGSKNNDLRDPQLKSKRKSRSLEIRKRVKLINNKEQRFLNKAKINRNSFKVSKIENFTNKNTATEKDNDTVVIKDSIILPSQTEELKQKNHEHVIHCAQGLKIFSGQSAPNDIIQLKDTEILQKNKDDKRKLLVLDMDETLMHTIHHIEGDSTDNSSFDKEYDYIIPIKNQNDSKCCKLCINLRPYVREALKQLKTWYRIVVFTASVQNYADSILDFIDPNNEIFEARYYRHHCLVTAESIHVKDMRIFEQSKNDKINWSLNEVVIVDNASHSFAYHISNGYPILPFYNDKQDRELIHMFYYLKRLATYQDTRPMLEKTFVLSDLLQEKISKLIEGIVEYSVQEMTDEDMLLFKNFFPEGSHNSSKEQIKEEEQGQSIEVASQNLPETPIKDPKEEAKSDDAKQESKQQDNIIHLSNPSNNEAKAEFQSRISEFEVESCWNIDVVPNEGKHTKFSSIVTPKKKVNTEFLNTTRVNQRLDEIRKRYLGNKSGCKESQSSSKSSLYKHKFVITSRDDYVEHQDYYLSKDNEDSVIIGDEYLANTRPRQFDNVQVLSSKISKGESIGVHKKWTKRFETPYYQSNSGE